MNVLRRRVLEIALVSAFAVVAAWMGLLLGGRQYEADATLRVPVASDVSGVQRDDLEYTDRLVNTYVRVAQSASLREAALERVPDARDVQVSVEPLPRTELMELRVQAGDPELAQRAANAWANALVESVRESAQRAQAEARQRITDALGTAERELNALRGRLAALEQGGDEARAAPLRETIRLREVSYQSLAQQAAAADVSSTPRDLLLVQEPAGLPGADTLSMLVKGLGLGLVIGLVAGVGTAFLLERRAPQLDTLDEIERASGASVLATVPAVAGEAPGIFNGTSHGQQAFGEIRAQLLSGSRASLPGVVLVTSAAKGDGKSLVAANLATSLSRARHRTLLVDGDLNQPCLHRYFGLENRAGLRDLLERETVARRDVEAAISPTGVQDLFLLTSGKEGDGAAELLASTRMVKAMALMERAYEFVVIDSPGLAPGGDAAALAARADLVVLVLRGTPVSDDVVQDARRQLEGSGARNVGVVVNRWRSPRGMHAGTL